MTASLREVLTAFETAPGPVSLAYIGRSLNLDRATLDGMIQYWVRKGKIREVQNATKCTTCGEKTGCPFIMEMPRSYELVTGETLPLIPLTGEAPCARR